jgi:phenylalanyl-tRNA synthetase alpha chain
MESNSQKEYIAKGLPAQTGTLHPLTLVTSEIVSIFEKQGFSVATGPELEDEYHNFDALNVPKDHPARDMQDTFFIKDRPGYVLRTHTSPVQIRYMGKPYSPHLQSLCQEKFSEMNQRMQHMKCSFIK